MYIRIHSTCYQVELLLKLYASDIGECQYTILYWSVKSLYLNDNCLFPCPVLISYVYKLYFFTQLRISILIQSDIPSSFGDSLQSDLSLCSAWCNHPIVLVAYILAVNESAGQIGQTYWRVNMSTH